MKITNIQQEHLYKAFGLFIEAFRFYIVELLSKEFGDKWDAAFVDALYPVQREKWDLGIKSGSSPDALIDFQHLKSFALRYKDLLKKDFGRDTNKLATRVETIYETRNKLAHYQNITSDEFAETFIQMKRIAQALNMDDLEQELNTLQHNKETKSSPAEKPNAITSGSVAPWFLTVRPHADIRQGRLDESVFAANIAEVALNNGREVYNNHVVFFEKTYFTAGLKNVAKTVVKGLNGTEDADNRVISLQTGFGGGKTHTLISLYHIARQGKELAQSSHAADLLEYTGIPQFEKANVAVFTNTTNDPANGRKVSEDLTINTIWGEIAYQLGGKTCYDIIRKNDEQLIAPGGLFKQVLAHAKPALILIDELADYCVKAAARKAENSSLADQTISFMQELTEAVAGTENCVAVITLPASPQEVGNTPEAQAILSSLQSRVSRVGADTQPVANDEIYEVIRRRLFEDIGDDRTVEAVVSNYIDMYQQYWTELPPNANKGEYKQRLLKSYPFHPELIDVFRVRWASNSDFQRTRGVLRLLAAIVSDLWKRQQSLPGSSLLIHSGQINFANLDALSGQLKKLYGNGYDAVISADVAGSSSNAFKIDENKADYGKWYLTQSVASVILQNSFGSEGSNKGISVAELKLNLLVPNGFNHNSINGALDELENKAYYLYYAQTGGNGKRYWFHTKPNINILINQAKSDVKSIDIDAEIIRMVKQRTANRINLFNNPIVDPSEDLPEQMRPTLVILSPQHWCNGGLRRETEYFIEKIATKKGNSERVYRNTMLYLVPTEMGISKLQSTIREYLACSKINQDYGAQLEPEQKSDLRKRMEDAQKQSEASLAAAYSNVIKYSTKQGVEILAIKQFKDSLDAQINSHILETLKTEEWLLENVGLGTLRSNGLLPTIDDPIKVKEVYEAFIRYDDKPMIIGKEAVTRSLQKYCTHGELAIASGDGINFSRIFYQENMPFLDVDDASIWLVDKSLALRNEPPESNPSIYPSASTGPVVQARPGASLPDVVEINSDEQVKRLESIQISGKVSIDQYTELFEYFIRPFIINNNMIDVNVSFNIKATASSPLREDMIQYKSAKEAASQLGLKFEKTELD